MVDIRRRRERKVAQDHGGREQPASGALPGFKRDARRSGIFLLEHKLVYIKHHRFDSRDFKYLMRQCRDQVPAYCIEFFNQGGLRLYIVPDMLLSSKASRNILAKYSTLKLTPEYLGATITFPNVVVRVITRAEFDTLIEEVSREY